MCLQTHICGILISERTDTTDKMDNKEKESEDDDNILEILKLSTACVGKIINSMEFTDAFTLSSLSNRSKNCVRSANYQIAGMKFEFCNSEDDDRILLARTTHALADSIIEPRDSHPQRWSIFLPKREVMGILTYRYKDFNLVGRTNVDCKELATNHLMNVFKTDKTYVTINQTIKNLPDFFLWKYVKKFKCVEIVPKERADTLNITTDDINFVLGTVKSLNYRFSVNINEKVFKLKNSIYDECELLCFDDAHWLDTENLLTHTPLLKKLRLNGIHGKQINTVLKHMIRGDSSKLVEFSTFAGYRFVENDIFDGIETKIENIQNRKTTDGRFQISYCTSMRRVRCIESSMFNMF
ncbi:hypothetical protein L3Y34_011541 [Caenorhabditis briggsae]|uniref:F-box domain-containing protein n=3 Tax=Caenorhabditis briggsae TaxID=6238 RepID=A0AAE9CUJ7_CAEBR|nr:hypothetical protein L3Y34_011541 [Caenorhabditis briggsae]